MGSNFSLCSMHSGVVACVSKYIIIIFKESQLKGWQKDIAFQNIKFQIISEKEHTWTQIVYTLDFKKENGQGERGKGMKWKGRKWGEGDREMGKMKKGKERLRERGRERNKEQKSEREKKEREKKKAGRKGKEKDKGIIKHNTTKQHKTKRLAVFSMY